VKHQSSITQTKIHQAKFSSWLRISLPGDRRFYIGASEYIPPPPVS